MSAWTASELDTISRMEGVELNPLRPDGGIRTGVVVWAVVDGGAVYVRSAVRGRKAVWFRAVQATHRGHLGAAALQKDVLFEDADPAVNDALDAAYRKKYRRYAGRILDSCLTPEARATTTRLMPA